MHLIEQQWLLHSNVSERLGVERDTGGAIDPGRSVMRRLCGRAILVMGAAFCVLQGAGIDDTIVGCCLL